MRAISLIGLSALLSLGACQDPANLVPDTSRDEVRIVGSSTVFPFAKIVSDSFQSIGEHPSPILESTGTGGGIQLFCDGIGASTPDIVNASRRMKASELARCAENGVEEVVEFKVGVDGLALAQSTEGMAMNLTVPQIYQALAARPFGKDARPETWAEIDPSLPDIPIKVYGPPKTSGTRDSFEELIMEVGCASDPAMEALKDSDEDAFKKVCTDVRTDGAYINTGENDNLIVQKITGDPNAVGIFSYSYLDENAEAVRGVTINGVTPEYDSIATGDYPGARPLYLYVKKRHVNVIPGLKDYLAEFIALAIPNSPLADAGMIALPEDQRTDLSDRLESLPAIKAADLG
ncbi:substrate-binding domain-containing protein [Alterisphingorhabdus coralli]|uniref:Substrate-binding domain-containing protein n=1 Tax=Alterisphingorhabdus coralli TaxID=3071408 RepID=A0AA97HZV5_9SPHN|nr:substrate-binding domain-containing protein [Parasphingorhabdus sp. SCSIO 66989]WOE74237.1 substrate-binding domain-containing protein [Parasphingorhabdus sp. SCSIO 66989]